MKKRLLIADDHTVVRDGIRSILKDSPEYRIVAEAEDGEQAVRLANECKPDLAIMDISMPKVDGIKATALIKKQNPGIRVIILSVHENEEYANEAFRAGALGYVLKTARKKEMFAAIEAAIAGQRFLSPGISKILIDSFVHRAKPENLPLPGVQGAEHGKLTKRELEVLQCIVKGLTNRKIAESLSLGIGTINSHRNNLMQKLQIHDTAGLVRYALKTGIVKL